MLTLTKPIIFFDIESTGLEITKDQIIELAAYKVMPDGEKIKYYQLFKPTTTISVEAAAVHGFTAEMLEDKPTFKEKAKEVFDFFKDCDLAGYNIIRFDIPLLIEELHHANIHYNPLRSNVMDSFKILQECEPRNLSMIYKYYTGKDLINAHSAEADIEATMEIFEKQLEKYNLPNDIAQIQRDVITKRKDGAIQVDFNGSFTHKDGQYYYSYGKHKGQPITKANASYLDWMLTADFSYCVKHVAMMIKKKITG